jgi:acyl-CoA thioesterase FadM
MVVVVVEVVLHESKKLSLVISCDEMDDMDALKEVLQAAMVWVAWNRRHHRPLRWQTVAVVEVELHDLKKLSISLACDEVQPLKGVQQVAMV